MVKAMNNIYFLIFAYSFMWIIFGIYFYISGKKVSRLEREIQDIIENK